MSFYIKSVWEFLYFFMQLCWVEGRRFLQKLMLFKLNNHVY